MLNSFCYKIALSSLAYNNLNLKRFSFTKKKVEKFGKILIKEKRQSKKFALTFIVCDYFFIGFHFSNHFYEWKIAQRMPANKVNHSTYDNNMIFINIFFLTKSFYNQYSWNKNETVTHSKEDFYSLTTIEKFVEFQVIIKKLLLKRILLSTILKNIKDCIENVKEGQKFEYFYWSNSKYFLIFYRTNSIQ